uniref:Genome sequencing data, contig C309 n=2 Tax=Microcystis aeruginosa (strain PCC 7806) TaxID=267872 RepID=A8YGI4_MICA7|nr:unnamed protein product [Microcystis aeruginosa PCC 7806]
MTKYPICVIRDAIDILMENLSQSIVGQTESIRIVLVALLSGGHALLEDVPGVGKTLLADRGTSKLKSLCSTEYRYGLQKKISHIYHI